MRVEAETIAKRMTAGFFKEQQAHDPAWLLKFYEFLNGSYETFKVTPFVRLEAGNFVTPGSGANPNAYLWPDNVSDIRPEDFPLVCRSVLNESTRKLFTEKAPLRQPLDVDLLKKSHIAPLSRRQPEADTRQL